MRISTGREAADPIVARPVMVEFCQSSWQNFAHWLSNYEQHFELTSPAKAGQFRLSNPFTEVARIALLVPCRPRLLRQDAFASSYAAPVIHQQMIFNRGVPHAETF